MTHPTIPPDPVEDPERLITLALLGKGLRELVDQLAHDSTVPEGWEPAAWSFIKGMAASQLLLLSFRLTDKGVVP